MTDWLWQGDFVSAPINGNMILLGMLLAFLCGHVIAWIYMLTHSGLSYSKSFVISLVFIPIIVSMVMMVLSNNLVTAFGLMAVFAIVRFRNILRDTLDTSYILAVIVIGMACGTLKFSSAVIGCALSAFMLLYFWTTSFGTRRRFDLILNLHWEMPLLKNQGLQNLLERHSRKIQLASQRTHEGFDGTDLSYRLLLRDPRRSEDLYSELRKLDGVSKVTGIRSDEESEV
jgi:hypothetical protein